MSRILTDFGVVAIPSIDPLFGRTYVRQLPGTSIARCVDEVVPEKWGPARKQIRVTVNGHVILPELWGKVKPKAGAAVLIEVVPADSSTLRSIFTIVVAIAAVAAGQFYGPGLALAAFGAEAGSLGSILTSAALSTAIVTAGSLLINALIPIKNDKDVPIYTISGLRNRATPDGVIPVNFGRNRVAPVYAMLPWSESIGDDRFVNALLIFAKGMNSVEGLQFGETPLEKYQDVTYEVRQGMPGQPPHTLCNRLVIEKALNIGVQTGGVNGGPQYRVTARDVTDCSFDISFPNGLGGARQDGDLIDCSVTIQYRYRRVGTNVWSAAQASTITARKMGVLLTRSFPIVFPVRGQYEIELTRTSGDFDFPEFDSNSQTKRTGRSFWTALRSFRPEYPIPFAKPCTTIAVRMRGNAQLNGSIDEINAIITSICEVIDPTTGAVTLQPTANPASLYRHEMLKVMTYPLGYDEIDEMRAFYKFCQDRGLAYNRWINSDKSVLDLISEICAAGRASPHDTGQKWDVIIDQPSDMVAALISPENSYEFSAEVAFVQFPHAFRVSFQDETNNYSAAERVIRWPGYDGPITIYEALELPGYTNPTLVWIEARRRQYEVIYRATTYKVKQDIENLTVGRGDRVYLSHDLLDTNLAAGRVKFITGGTAGTARAIALTCDVEMVAGKVYGCRWRRNDGLSFTKLLVTIPGISDTVVMAEGGRTPAEGDLIFIGEFGREAIACTIQQIERMDKFTAEITMKDHAPEIIERLNGDTVPPWDGRVGTAIEGLNDIPNAPTVTDIVSGSLAQGAATAEIPYPVIVSVVMPRGSTVPISSYLVRHRVLGAANWNYTGSSVGSPRILLPGYAKYDIIEISAQAISLKGTPGPFGAPNVVHTVGSDDLAAPLNLTLSVERATTSTGSVTARLRLVCDASPRANAFLIGQYRKVGTTSWQGMGLDTSNLYSVLSAEVVDGTAYEAQGAMSSSGGSEVTAFVVAAGSPVTVVADNVAPNAPTYTSIAQSGKSLTHSFKQSTSANARNVLLKRANGFGKAVADATTILTRAEAAGATDTFAETIDVGFYQWWLQAQNPSGVLSPVSLESPRSILEVSQPGNLTQYPNDLTNAVWTKTNVTAAQNGTGPDGATSTLIQETAAAGNVTHGPSYKATGLTSGSRLRGLWGVKAAGRTNGRMDFTVSSGTGAGDYARVLFDLAAGTATVSTISGTTFSLVTATIIKVSADFFLVGITANTAPATGTGSTMAIESRLLFGNDAKAIGYTGDTTKGMQFWACSLAVAA